MQGFALCAQRRFGEAVLLLKQAIQLRPEFLMAHAALAASLGHLGDRPAAREVIARFGALTRIDIHAFARTYPDPDARNLLLEGIDLALREG